MNRLYNTIKKYSRTFWVANSIELIERAAWYGFFMLFANYLTRSSDLGGLEFSQSEKGLIMGIGTAILYFLPVLTGAIADKFGYKKILMLSFAIYASAFFIFPLFNSFAAVFSTYIYLAIGAAMFKPIISATIAKTTNDETSSVGFGIFYMIVNTGSFLGPILTIPFRDDVFYISGSIILLNFILILFYKEPGRDKESSPLTKSIKQIFKNIYTVILDYKFMIFLIIVGGFWTMYFQLFMTLPVFIEEWVDSSSMYNFFNRNFPVIAEKYGSEGQMQAEFITNFDSMFIILFQIIVSTIIMRMRPLSAMISGFIIATIGMSLTVVTDNVIFTFLAMFIFAIGEMSASPKITEYVGKIAPTEKKALFMGFTFIPIFLGNLFSVPVSGTYYEKLSDKFLFAKKYAMENNLIIDESLSKNQLFESIASQLRISTSDLTNTLWDTYNPYNIWYIIFGIGIVAAISLFLYDRLIVKKNS